jgi:hypothetical protein
MALRRPDGRRQTGWAWEGGSGGKKGIVSPPDPEPPQVRDSARAARKVAEAAGGQATRYGEAVRGLLAAHGPHEPREWSQGELRTLIAELIRRGDVTEAFAVRRYADARVLWSKAIRQIPRGEGRGDS